MQPTPVFLPGESQGQRSLVGTVYGVTQSWTRLKQFSSSSSGMDILVFPHSSVGKESTCNAGDPGSIPGLGRSSGEGKGYPLQYSDLENSMDCIIHGVIKSQTPLRNFHFHFHGYLIFDKAGKNIQWRKTVSSISGSGKLDSYVQKNEIGTFPNIIHKNKLKMN